MANLKVNIAGVEFKNPIITASGCFGFGREYEKMYPLEKLGGMSLKGTTYAERLGNPPPRIAETASGMLNSVGLQNPGVEKVISEELPKLKKCFHKPVIANVSGFSIEEYEECCEKIDAQEQVGLIEKEHEARYLKLLSNVEKGEVFAKSEKVVWQCSNCGYIHEGEKAPEVCPVCAHEKAFFQIHATNY